MMAKTMTREQFEKNIRVGLLMGNDDPEFEVEVQKLLKRVKELRHEYRDDRLYVGSHTDPMKWHEVRRSVNDTVYCKCRAYGFRHRPGKGDGLCKHVLYCLGMRLRIPSTAELKAKGGK